MVRIAATSAIVVLGVFCALLLAIRFVAFPQLETHRAEIGRWLGSRIGQPVEIERIVTGWDGWNPTISVRGFRVRDRANAAALLDLPRVDLVVAWTSLPLLDLRLKELLIESPRLSVRRDPAGGLHLAGIEMDADAQADDSAFADWVMRQPQIVIHDALILWNDELRRAPQLLLDHVQFRLVQRFGRRHIGLTGVPPPELAAPIDLRAEVIGPSLKDTQALRGKLYLRLDYADVAAWREWLPLPFDVTSGKGALRLWVDFAASQARDVVADLELADVSVTLGDTLAPLALAHVAGRAGWKRSEARTDFTATQLSFTLPDGSGLAPTDFTLALATPAGNARGGGSMTFRTIDLQPLAAIAAQLPLPDAVRRDIARYEPRGQLANGTVAWRGSADAPDRYSLKTEFRNLYLASTEASPGAANLSGSLDATERGGDLRIASQAATLALPRIFAAPLFFDSVKGNVSWQRAGDGASELRWKDVAFANADLAGTTTGTWTPRATGPGEVDVNAHLTRANLAGAYRYLPVALHQPVRDWLRRALIKGTAREARLTLDGDLAQFPFPRGKGRFELAVKAQDATLQYADDWPPVTAIAGDVRVDNARLSINAASGRVLGAQVGATHAEIADLHDAQPVLRIDGSAAGPTSEFLAFVAQSPVAGWIGHVVDAATATGDGRLALRFALPLHDTAQTTVAGEYRFAANAVRLPGMPPLTAVNGKLLFTEHDVRAPELTAEAFGGPVKLQLASEGGKTRVTGNGTANMQLVRNEYAVPLLDHVSGSTDWRLTLDAREQQLGWTLESTLQGAAIDLPAPIGKRAADAVPLRVERRALPPGEDRITIDYGGIARALLHRQVGTQSAPIDRALVLVGKAIADAAEPEQPGVWIRGDVAAVNVDDWLAVDRPAGDARTADAAALPLNGIDLHAAHLQAFGRSFSNLKTTARRQNADWRLVLDGNDLAGTATWRSATATQPNGRLVARLTRLATPPTAIADPGRSDAGAPAPSPATANRWPAVDLVADAFQKKGRTLGRLELLAQPSGTDWQIHKLALSNDVGRIDAEGWWRNSANPSQTLLDVAIDVKDAGGFLERFGWPDAVQAAPTKIDGQVSWSGAPSDFDYPSLTGSFRLRSGAGQFTKLEPGVGRLLGVLSLQALPRRISLDFRDVFSEGFAFDSVAGDVRMQSGIMHTDDLRLAGPAAAVAIAGDVDLARETQQLTVRVKPSLSTGVSAGAAALFIANPLLGAAVGAGTLLAQKMLDNPFDRLFSYEYAVSGSWDDPVVSRTGAQPATAAPSSAAPSSAASGDPYPTTVTRER